MLKYKWMCIAVLCCAIFAACEPASDTPTAQTPITFSSGIVRAAQVKVPYDNARMWAYYTDDNSAVNWVYGNATTPELATLSEIDPTAGTAGTAKLTINGNTKYWFDGTYNFFSIYSEDFINGNLSNAALDTENNQLTFDYDITKQNELRYACHLNTRGTTNRTTEVNLNYQHLLSRIKFQGFSKDASNTVTVTNVEISGLPKSATISLNIPDDDLANEDITSLEAAYDFSESETTSLLNTDVEFECNNADGLIVLDKMVFPQSVAAETITFSVTYNTQFEIGKQKSVTLPTSTWLPGKSYLYKFYIQSGGPIEIGTYEILDWEDGGSVNIMLPK